MNLSFTVLFVSFGVQVLRVSVHWERRLQAYAEKGTLVYTGPFGGLSQISRGR